MLFYAKCCAIILCVSQIVICSAQLEMINDPFQAIEILKNEAKKAEFLATKEGRELLRKIETSYQIPWQKLQAASGSNAGGEKRMLNLTEQCNKDVDQLLRDLGEFEYYALLSKYIYMNMCMCAYVCVNV